jgi:hypothetical protein
LLVFLSCDHTSSSAHSANTHNLFLHQLRECALWANIKQQKISECEDLLLLLLLLLLRHCDGNNIANTKVFIIFKVVKMVFQIK